MLKYLRIIQDSARRIAKAANRTVGDFIQDHVEQEPEFTGEMLGRMKQAMDGYKARGVKWTARTLTSQGPNAQENTFGADFLGVVEFDLPDYHVKKGFLAEVKRIEPKHQFGRQEWGRMKSQCEQMLSITTESFVFIYARAEITVVPALAIVSATARPNPHEFHSRTALRFYMDHFECFVGDLKISTADIETLERLRVD